jgi:hypothetical protein
LTLPAVLSKGTGFGELQIQSTELLGTLKGTLRSKVIENLAVVGYDADNLVLTPYDWRLSMYNLEERDGYFSRLKTVIEGFK